MDSDAPERDLVSNWAIEDCIDMGQQYLKELRFDDALKSFSDALDIDDSNEAAVEGRLQINRQMKQYNAMQKDAERLIELAPTKGLPYICQSECLLVRGKLLEAMEVLRQCQFRVLHTDPLNNEINDLLFRLRKTPIDFILRLPHDILQLVFSFIPERFKTLRTCTTVSRSWRHCFTTAPILWRNIHMYHRYKSQDDDCVAFALEQYAKYAMGATRMLCIPVSNPVLGILSTGFHGLRTVDLSTSHTRRRVDDTVLYMTMSEVASSWDCVCISDMAVSVVDFVTYACTLCPNLRSLAVYDIMHDDSWTELSRNGNTDLSNQNTMESVESLCIYSSEQMNASLLCYLLARCPNLRYLEVEQCYALEEAETYLELAKLKRLELLSLSTDIEGGIDGDALAKFVKNSESLTELDLQRAEIETEALYELARSMNRGILTSDMALYHMDDPRHREQLEEHISEYEQDLLEEENEENMWENYGLGLVYELDEPYDEEYDYDVYVDRILEEMADRHYAEYP
ncbi:hypothetical protein BCR43DRAFT_524390 [Syncephalastrum racemosum]|uniref:F-box domain-containing protein n=1 Tax=Syncephalastrum racemosum TaxID=13706 RepID=A0A1X2HBS5_SYNRA|nr:hypothetical protein BCR43DRAFT_524390 [Syncephalastrum racemosum]